MQRTLPRIGNTPAKRAPTSSSGSNEPRPRGGGSEQSSDAISGLTTKQAELDSRITNQVDLIAQQLPRIDGAITSQTEAFSTSEADRRTQAQAAIDALTAEKTELMTSLRSASDELLTTTKTAAGELSEEIRTAGAATQTELDGLLTQAKELVGVIGRTGMTGGYQQQANRERGDADRWRKMSVGFSIAAVVVLAGVIVWSGIEHPSWPITLGRIVLAGGLGGIGAYAARQAADHRKRSNSARNRELALASIGPYLEAIEDAERKKILEAFAYIFFASTDTEVSADRDNGPSSMAAALEAATSLTTALRQ